MIVHYGLQKVLTARGEQPVSGAGKELWAERMNHVTSQDARAHELMDGVYTRKMEHLLKRMRVGGMK